MNEENPILILVLMAIVGYVAFVWMSDFKKASAGVVDPGAMPGARSCSPRMLVVAIVGALFLLGLETWGELALGIAESQSEITWLFAGYTLFAAFGEELVFRGFLFYDKRGRGLLIVSCLAISLLFALLHGYVIKWEEGALLVDLGLKGLFSTAFLFLGSLWFYWLRFSKGNPNRSLIPCIAAHAAKNLGVVVVKASQGFVVGLF